MIKSVFLMIAVRGITLLFPLLLIPIQLKLLGIEQYGQYNLLLAISSLAAVLINYGFDYTACRDIAIEKDSDIINKIWVSVLLSKTVIYVPVMLGLCFYFLFHDAEYLPFISVGIFLVSQILIPIYIFQGLKRMGYLLYNTLFLNVAFIIFLVLLLYFNMHANKDIVYFGYAVINFLAAIQMNIYIFRKIHLKITRIKISDITIQLKNGFWVFLSRVMNAGLSQLTIIILSTMLSANLLGIYTLGDKLVRAANSFFYAIQQATYPYFCDSSRADNNKKFFSLVLILVLISSLSVVLFYNIKFFVLMFFPVLENYYLSITFMFLTLIPMAISGMIGVNYLLAKGFNKQFAFSLAVGAISNLLLLLCSNINNSIFKAVSVLLITEVIVALTMLTIMILSKKTQ